VGLAHKGRREEARYHASVASADCSSDKQQRDVAAVHAKRANSAASPPANRQQSFLQHLKHPQALSNLVRVRMLVEAQKQKLQRERTAEFLEAAKLGNTGRLRAVSSACACARRAGETRNLCGAGAIGRFVQLWQSRQQEPCSGI
jgi:hypothetical protein